MTMGSGLIRHPFAVARPTIGGVPALVQLQPPGEPGASTRITIYGWRATIGRSGGCDVLVVAEGVSRRHAQLIQTPDGWFVQDLRSTNGTYVNNIAVIRSRLRDGDFLSVGAAIFTFDARPNLPGRRPVPTWN